MKPKIFPIILTVALAMSVIANIILSLLLVNSKNLELTKTNQVSVLEQENSQLRVANEQNQTSTTTTTTTTPQTTTSTAPDTNVIEVDANTNKFSSSLFDMNFDFDKTMGSVLTTSTKIVYATNSTLFCLTERVTFSDSPITITLTKGAPECLGATGAEVRLREESLTTLDGKLFTFNVNGHSNSAQTDLSAVYISVADAYRGVKFETSVDTKTEITTQETQIKQMVNTMSYNDKKMLSETTESTVTK